MSGTLAVVTNLGSEATLYGKMDEVLIRGTRNSTPAPRAPRTLQAGSTHARDARSEKRCACESCAAMMACTPWNAHAGCKAKLLLPRRRLRGKPRAEPALFVAEERTKQREPCVSRSRSWPSPGRAGTKMQWPHLPRPSCKCPVQLLLCPPSHSQLCELPLHLSPRPQPQRHARANEPESSSPSSSSREAAAKSHLPLHPLAHSKESAIDNLSIQHSSRLHSSLSENSIDLPHPPIEPLSTPSLQPLLTSSSSLHPSSLPPFSPPSSQPPSNPSLVCPSSCLPLSQDVQRLRVLRLR